ncbi:hypothetical protein NC653_017811 [Populus alba x Populus x berolinensis]|uniref:Uncharacterized protein n=1 Tax=Populus alba x Populus x berolinensis TaxID=444605 RepID=A0AAD6QRH8_9ROSI|nr:hypothetical protein NC653_017811 [Populus alba x Populus x berolinensis]
MTKGTEFCLFFESQMFLPRHHCLSLFSELQPIPIPRN